MKRFESSFSFSSSTRPLKVWRYGNAARVAHRLMVLVYVCTGLTVLAYGVWAYVLVRIAMTSPSISASSWLWQ